MIWYDMIWYDTIWYNIIWYDMIWYHIIWHDMIWYDRPVYDVIWYDLQKKFPVSSWFYISIYNDTDCAIVQNYHSQVYLSFNK